MIRELHFCVTFKQLLTAYAHALLSSQKVSTTVLYPQDFLVLDELQKDHLQIEWPQIELIEISDAEWMDEYCQLPRIFPDILRRNISFCRHRQFFQRPHEWEPQKLKNRIFETGFIYNPVVFSAKVIRGRCSEVVVREAGLHSYDQIKVTGFKKWLRWFSGLPAKRQILGEEKWVDKIQLEFPEELPEAVAPKGERFSFDEIFGQLSRRQISAFAKLFPGFKYKESKLGKTALILTQPLDLISMCSFLEKQDLYNALAQVLVEAGFQISVKHHPRDVGFTIDNATELPSKLPSEFLSFLLPRKYDLVVAICSNSLLTAGGGLAEKGIQLVEPERFNALEFENWSSNVKVELSQQLQ